MAQAETDVQASESLLGWVVIERNQVSRMPEVLECCDILDSEQEAAERAALEQADNRKHGRREHYSIAKVIEVSYD